MLTSPGRHSGLFESLPPDIAGLTRVGHGLLIHEYLTHFYDVELSDEDREPVHLRAVEQLLTAITERDGRPLDVPRAPGERTAANCRHFTVLLVSILQARGVRARARCGFGAYFNEGMHEDHWVCEYWDGARWVLVDSQIDEVQHARFPIDFDLTDVPRDRFLTAGAAWQLCRAGKADPDTFGLSMFNETGYWWIAANMVRDAAALVGVPLLPWDVWGSMPEPEDTVDMAFFDRLAALTEHPDAPTDELRNLLRDDERIRVPAKVRNMARKREEAI
nr:transglutaminase domain-containing protein [Kibdelosporangium sp. MJ126-NF4]CEL22441.1 Transglutaminase-like enzyme [Kibdelosporangium sp. MJ126-NF4]CTQ89296.1 Transglutaminase-like enzyme [Kibdelosporangium sp. MJ126-NF4]